MGEKQMKYVSWRTIFSNVKNVI